MRKTRQSQNQTIKTRICYTEVEFLGNINSNGKAMQTNVRKWLMLPHQKPRSLLWAVGFLRKFIPNCAEILKPLTVLTGKIKPDKLVWQAEHQNAFDKVKHVLTSKPVLKLYKRDKEHVIQTDACHEQIAATFFFKGKRMGNYTQSCIPSKNLRILKVAN